MSGTRRCMSRRGFVRGALATGLTLPFLPSLASRGALADGRQPKRLVCLVTQQGQRASGYLCAGGERDFDLSYVLEPLAPFRDRMIAMHGLRGFKGGHPVGTKAALTAGWNPPSEIYVSGDRVPTPSEYFTHYHTGPSIDQLVAQRFGSATALPSLQVGVKTLHGGFVSYAAPDLPVPPVQSPLATFERIAGYAFADPEEMERVRARNLWVVDAVARNFESVQGRLSTSERRVVDAHLTMLHEHEARLGRPTAAVSCDLPEGTDVARDASFEAHTQAQMENLITALACDVTRVVSVSWGKEESNYDFPWLGISDSWHDPIAHGNGPNHIEKHNRIKRWHFEQVAELCRRLDEIPDGDGATLLDNTLIFVADELQMITESQLADSHGRRNMPGVLIGDAQGFFDTGRFLDMGRRPYGDLLFTIGHAMGLVDLETFGARGGPDPEGPPPAALLDDLLA